MVRAFWGLFQVQVVRLDKLDQFPLIIAAHETGLAHIAVNSQGSLLATASRKVGVASACLNQVPKCHPGR